MGVDDQEVPFCPASRKPSPAGIDALSEYRRVHPGLRTRAHAREVDHLDVKPSTAVCHLFEMAPWPTTAYHFETARSAGRWRSCGLAATLLEHRSDLEAGSVVLVLDLPPDELPWLAMYPVAEWVGPAPARQEAVPLVVPTGPVAGVEPAPSSCSPLLVSTLRDRYRGPRRPPGWPCRRVPIVEPSTDELRHQLSTEVDASGTHLRKVLAAYWDTDWRRLHKGVDTSPEDQLWRAAQAAVEITDALHELRSDGGQHD